MKSHQRFLALAAVLLTAGGCEIFEDRTPEQIFFRMEGTPGESVTIVYSKQFVAGVDEIGVTRVEIFRSDTVTHTLPIDTVIDVRFERRIFIQAEPTVATDTIDVNATVDVDDRGLFDRSGKLYPTIPWRFLYEFNARFTESIEVVI